MPAWSGTRDPGDPVTEGEPLFTLLTDEPSTASTRALDSLEGGYDISPDSTPDPSPLVIDRIS